MTQAEKFKSLHHQKTPFILPNVWEPGGAYLVEKMGFQAVATTSAGIAYSNAMCDGSIIDPTLMFETIEKIVNVVSIPVTADVETGYGDLEKTLKTLQSLGVVGANIEDARGSDLSDLIGFDEAVSAIKSAKETVGDEFVINARTDTYLTGQKNALEMAIERGNAFLQAGADCIFVPGVRDPKEMAVLVKEIPAPINVVAGLSGTPLSMAEYAACGVKRISTGGSLMRRCFAMLETCLQEMRDQGSFGYANDAIADKSIDLLFKGRSD
ncbi:isocitrate lyase/PEP mutase family protein [Terasakiella pusilla]|uniref:isocitrate lyase/PEP mutase family protein n=1 Tax=Terasakiella pusilla TaxID=64973 RepID=UPI003AA8D3CB